MTSAVVELRGVSKAYGDVRALDDITLTVRQGELLSLLGPSGCGKTTTLNVVAGFVAPDAGRVFVDGADVTDAPPYRRGLGVVFQSYALFPHMTVEENVAFGLRERGVPRREVATRVREALALVRLPGAGARRPRELSGGMQQRVALARALVIQPRVLLLDEPLAALDKKLREEMRAELKEIQQRVGVTTVFVTHDQHEALGLSDRIAVLNAGRLEQLGSPRDIYERPATRFVADFVGASTVLEAAATGGTTVELAPGVRLDVKLERLLTHGERVRLLVRPERIELGAVIGLTGAVIGITGAVIGITGGGGGNAVAARVTRVMYLGDHTEVGLELPGGNRALATVRGGPALAVGETVTAVFPSDAFMEVGQ